MAVLLEKWLARGVWRMSGGVDSPTDDRTDGRRVDSVNEFHVADPRGEDETKPAADGFFVAGHRGEQRVACKTGAGRHGHR
jgi:hypothetical protein